MKAPAVTLQRHSGQIQGKQCNQIPAQPTEPAQKRNSSVCTALTAHIPTLLSLGPSSGSSKVEARQPGCALAPLLSLLWQRVASCQYPRQGYQDPKMTYFPLSQPHSHPVMDLLVLFSLCCCFGLHIDKWPAHPAKSDRFLPFQVLQIPSGMVNDSNTLLIIFSSLSCSIAVKLYFKERSINSRLTLLESCPSFCQTSISTYTLGFLHTMHRKHKY